MLPPAVQESSTGSPAADASPDGLWTCPFCALHCDRFGVRVAEALELVGSDCPRAREALLHFPARPGAASPRVGGKAVALATALDTAAALLARARQPLLAGLGVDVAGMRAAFRVAEATGAIVDHRHGDALMHSVRAIQDRGLYYTTLAEVRNHADVIVCIGTTPTAHYPEFFRRCGFGEPGAGPATRRVVFVGAGIDPALTDRPGVVTHAIPFLGDVYATLATLSALVGARRIEAPEMAASELPSLAQDLLDARYAVLVWEPGVLDAHGALAAERINTIVSVLNRTTRAASLALSGSDGAYTANQAMTWLSGLPLRTGFHPAGLVHEPTRYAAERLLAAGAVDALLWVTSFGPQAPPPRPALPTIILGHPELDRSSDAGSPETVFVPVSTPGIGSTGHVFRLDGGVALPLRAVYADTLPTAAYVLDALAARLAAARAEHA